MDFLVCPLVAAALGFQPTWSIAGSLVFGAPLVALYAAVTPVAFAGNETFGVPAPWIASIQTTPVNAATLILSRLTCWCFVYVVFIVAGLLSRRLSPLQESANE